MRNSDIASWFWLLPLLLAVGLPAPAALAQKGVPDEVLKCADEGFERIRGAFTSVDSSFPLVRWALMDHTPDLVARARLGPWYRIHFLWTKDSVLQWLNAPEVDPRPFAQEFRYYFTIVAEDSVLLAMNVMRNETPSGEPLHPGFGDWVAEGYVAAGNRKVVAALEAVKAIPGGTLADLNRVEVVRFSGLGLIKSIVSRGTGLPPATVGDRGSLVDADTGMNDWKAEALRILDAWGEHE